MKVFLIRHGSTAGNLEHRYVGKTDEELTQEAVQELRLVRGRCPVPKMVFVSPLKRCCQTAGILFPEMEKVVLSDLRECDFGEFEYRNYQELQRNADYQRWIDSGGTLAFPGGESREEFCDRCCRAFLEGCRQAEEKSCESAAFVVHGGTIMAVLDRYSHPHKDYFEWQVKNAQGFAAELQNDPSGKNAFLLCDVRPLFQGDATGIEEQFVMKKNKRLRCGYTTGSCAAAAAKAAAEMLLTGRSCGWADLMTPKGVRLHLPVLEQRITGNSASCAVRKYAGDDPDATDGILVYAKAEKVDAAAGETGDQQQDASESHVKVADHQAGSARKNSESQIILDGGIGVGRVTKPGLEQPVGAAAINRVPREMITREVEAVCESYEYTGKIKITISVPAGEEIAKKTFNPHIGIVGGISILGTSGIVVPMSEEALIASIHVEMKQKFENGEKYLLITPGNYGADFIRRRELSKALDAEHSMKCSNYVGETLDMASELGVKGILFVAHIGKFIKVSGGVMNTHSAYADCRAELIAAQAVRAMQAKVQKDTSAKQERETQQAVQVHQESGMHGRNQCSGASGQRDMAAAMEIAVRLLGTNTTEEAVGILKEEGLLEETMTEILNRIQFHLQKRCQGALETEVVLFSNQYGYLGETKGAESMMEKIIRQNGLLDVSVDAAKEDEK